MNDDRILLESQQAIHELIARQLPLDETLNAIAVWINRTIPEAMVSVMRFDPELNTLSLVPSSWFSERYLEVMQGLPVIADSGTCGTAAYERRLIVTEDIREDSRWDQYRDIAEAECLRACWSTPIITARGELLGTFATYYRYPMSPTESDQRSLEYGASLAALVLLRDRQTRDHQTLSEWHQALFNNQPDGVFTYDLQGYLQSCNAALERISGYSQADIVGAHFTEFVEPNYRERTLAAFEKARGGESVAYEIQALHKAGYCYHLEISNFPVVIEGKIVGVYGVCRDITERKERDTELRMLKRGVEASPHGIVMADARQPNLPVVYANSSFLTMTGYSEEEVLGHSCHFLQNEDTDPANIDRIRAGLRDRTEVNVVLRNYRKNGVPFWNHLRISPVLDRDGVCTHFIWIQQDITRQKEQEAQILFQARHDVLTGLPNLETFTEMLGEALEKYGDQPSRIVVLYVDLDGFKAINEGLGHSIGNQVLVTVAGRLGSVAGKTATVARVAADEFGVLLSGFDNREMATELAQRFLEAVAEPIIVENQRVHLSASIGVAGNALPLEQPHEIIQYADLALRQAKGQGRNTWQWYRGQRVEKNRQTLALRQDLYTALKEQQFEMHYQPLVDSLSGRLRSVEALVRWRHPSRGMVSPCEFIPLAEQTGQIIPLGRWILQQACRDMVDFSARTGHDLPVAVNISSLQFLRDGFLEDVKHTLAESGLSPMLLELEVTESVLLDGAEPVIELMQTLKAKGIRVALDDFGTGFSSLSYLRDLPTHRVKLDRSFIQAIETDHRMAAIVQAVITMAHNMDMSVVAEGIESLELQQDLARRHCDLLQGNYFARPMSLADLKVLPSLLPGNRSA
ncbi:EAL domain-containing protein [Marinobacter orientalis]|uniref:EAL domain-containing protein n=1 Tax=Marinobacter orientalis TaxID=1928859 RepID=A0A7Y0REZ3_9GAMM|nr:EAL domain-containing protein [Marinobacter orientalis]NMT65010.1 EAL domain-containing protein [Marinobacter orientalis]TGX48098.1 EAL domain-containing protein [Marinobacter orientalis]